MSDTQDALIQLARDAATQNVLDPATVCAVCEKESTWNPWAVRFEPAFYDRYTKPMHLTDTEEYTRAISWGLMQIMGETAREFGFVARFVSGLCDPATGLLYGCLKLKRCFDNAGGDTSIALSHYNGGGDASYPGDVMSRIAKYQ